VQNVTHAMRSRVTENCWSCFLQRLIGVHGDAEADAQHAFLARGELSSRLKTMPDPRNKDDVVWLNPVANNIAASAKANDDLANAAILGGLTDFGKMLDALKRSPDRTNCTHCSIRILTVEKLANALDVRDSLGR